MIHNEDRTRTREIEDAKAKQTADRKPPAGGGGEDYSLTGLKKLICNPPAVKVASEGDPEVRGLFEGAGAGLAFALSKGDQYSASTRDAYFETCAGFERAVSLIEHDYVKARQALAASTAALAQAAVDDFLTALGVEVYGGG